MIPPSSFSREVPSPHKVLLSPIRSGRPSRQRQSKRTNLRLTSSSSSSSSSSCEDLSRCSEDSQETKLLSSFLEEITDPEPGKQLQQEKKRSSSSIPIAAHYLEPVARLQTVSWADQSGREEREDQREDRAKYFQHRVRTPYSFSLTDRQRLRERGMVVPSD